MRRIIRTASVLAPLVVVLATGSVVAQQPEPAPSPSPQQPEPRRSPDSSSGETLITHDVRRGDKCFRVWIAMKFEGTPTRVISTPLFEREISPCSPSYTDVVELPSTPTTPQGVNPPDNRPQTPSQGENPPPNPPQPQPPVTLGNWPTDVDWVKPGQNGATYEHHKDGSTVIKDRDGKVVGVIPPPIGADKPPVSSPTPIPLTGPSVEPNPNAIVTIDGTFRSFNGRWVRERMIDGRVVRDDGHFVDGRWVSEGEHKTVNIPFGDEKPQKPPVGQTETGKSDTSPVNPRYKISSDGSIYQRRPKTQHWVRIGDLSSPRIKIESDGGIYHLSVSRGSRRWIHIGELPPDYPLLPQLPEKPPTGDNNRGEQAVINAIKATQPGRPGVTPSPGHESGPSSGPKTGLVTPQETKTLPATLKPTRSYSEPKTTPRMEPKPTAHKMLRPTRHMTGPALTRIAARHAPAVRTSTVRPASLGHVARPTSFAHAAPRMGSFGGMRMGGMHGRGR